MINEYIVKYTMGNTYYELHISAHDEEQALKICETQIRFRHKSKAKINIVSIRKDGEEDLSIKVINKYVRKWYMK